MAIIRDELGTSRRVYIETRYGEDAVDRLRSLGARWDPGTKCWWVGSGKRAVVEAVLEAAGRAAPATEREQPDQIRLVARCRYKGREYYARFVGPTRRGHACRLVTLDHSLDFWAACAAPGDDAHDGSGDVAVVVKRYEGRVRWSRGRETIRPVTLADIQDFVAAQRDPATRRGECSECGSHGPAGEPCPDCHGEGSFR